MLMVRKKDLLISIIVFCTFKISYLSFYNRLFKWLYLLLGSMLILQGWLFLLSRKKTARLDLLVLLFVFAEWITTILNHGSISDLLIETETILLFHVSCRAAFQINAQKYIRYSRNYLLLLTAANTILAIVFYPNALFYYDRFSPAFLLGGDNTSTRIYILAFLFCSLNTSERKNSRGKNYPLLFSIINFMVFSLIRDIGNGKICSVVLLLLYIYAVLLKLKMPEKPLFKVLIVNIVLFVLLVVANRIDLFTFIVVKLLHRNLTLTTRTTIWQITIEKILEKPLLGNGYVSGATFESYLPSIIGVNAHNTILMVCFIGGVVLVAIFLYVLVRAARSFDNKKELAPFWGIPASFLAMFLRSQVEGGDAAYLIYMAVIISSFSAFFKSGDKGKVYEPEIHP